MLQEKFERVVMINLPSAKERLATATANCEKLGIEFEVVKAIAGTSKKVEMNTKPYLGWNRNAAALALTTLGIIKKAKKDKLKNIFIMEDDVDFIPLNAKVIFNTAFKNLPEDWDFFHLNVQHELPGKWVASCLEKLGGAWCCQAYGVNHTVFDAYIEELEKFAMPIDNITLNFHKSRGKSFATKPCVVVHHTDRYSTLREKIVEY